MHPDASSPIGIFDSGVGGLSVLRSIREQMRGEALIYVGDQGHVPYGPRPLEQVRQFSMGITRFLLERGAKIIVVACNSASAAALTDLRRQFADVPFVGMEPAVKPAAEKTTTGIVGVLATPATFQGALYASVVERFSKGVELLKSTCPGLVERIELGDLTGPATREILERALVPMLERDIDTVVLACTHYPFVIPLIQDIVGEEVRVIDPAPAVARQTARLLNARGRLRGDDQAEGDVRYFTSGDGVSFRSMLHTLLGLDADVATLRWIADGEVTAVTPAGIGADRPAHSDASRRGL